MGCNVESQSTSFKHCVFQGDNRTYGLLARTYFHKSIAGQLSTGFVSDYMDATYGTVGREGATWK